MHAISMTRGELTGHSALVAGGTGNVGRHIVRALLERGATVAVPSRSTERLAELRTAVGPLGEHLVTLTGDVADEGDAVRIRDEAQQRLPSPLDGVVASLGHHDGRRADRRRGRGPLRRRAPRGSRERRGDDTPGVRRAAR